MTSRLRMPSFRTQQSDSGSPTLPIHAPTASSSSGSRSLTEENTDLATASDVPSLAPPIGSTPGRPFIPTDEASSPLAQVVDTPQRQRRRVTILPPITATTLDHLQNTHSSSPPVQGRRRAHTVSVSLRSANRPKFDADEVRQPLTGITRSGRPYDVEEGLGRVRTTSTTRRRRSGTVGSVSDRAGTPVGFDMPVYSGDGNGGELQDDMVGLLDCIDPHVSTVNHLQNMTNSVLIPHFPQLWSRRPEVQLPETTSEESLIPQSGKDSSDGLPSGRSRSATTRSRTGTISRFLPDFMSGHESSPVSGVPSTSATDPPPSSSWGGAHPIPIPEEPATAEGSTEQDQRPSSYSDLVPPLGSASQIEAQEMEDDIADIKEDHELDRHVKHMLKQNKRAKAKRALQGLWTFVKTPMGFFTAVYGFCVAFWGAAIVLFLLGWIPTSSKYRQDVWVEISSQVTNGLFTLTGVGLIPWRAMDTYRMSVIWTLKSRSARRRKQRGLPPIEDENDLPDPALIKDYVHVLTDEEQERLRYQQEKFAQSQTWYRPHANATHRAFPMKWALWNTILMDGNSFFQCILCGCMWGMNWHVRPAWTTGTLIPCSFLCGIGAAVLIWQGSVRTKKNVEVSQKLREALSVPLAIGVPGSQNGTSLLAKNISASVPDVSESSAEKKPERKAGGEARRATVTFSNVTKNVGLNEEETRGDEEKGRERAITLAAPEVSRESAELSLEEKEAIAMKEVRSV
ncbi:hypothetical protein IAR55_004743 [Kwoniella newhampshirensis]|uniref:Uncharacterized protein n=1 Tax=Kwoniella newhampshirensis TaxID=1651941 RepID=A0AAW0YLQ8_9TREE